MKRILLSGLIIISFFGLYIASGAKVFNDEEFVNVLVNGTRKKEYRVIEALVTKINGYSVSEPVSIVNRFFHRDEIAMDTYTASYSFEPLVYIYNSHQKEEYANGKIIDASYYLREELKYLGIDSIVEENDFVKYMSNNNLSSNSSYKASRHYLVNNMKEYPNVTFYIDIHRDSVNKKNGTVSIDGIKYARLLFVVGLDHNNSSANLKLANTLNKSISSYKNLSRGVYTISDSVFNQDKSENMILLEIGGYENTLEEVKNSTRIVAKMIKEYINGR